MHALRQRVRIIVFFSFILSPSNCVIECVIPLGFASNNGTWKNKNLSACNSWKKSDKINNKKFKDQDSTSIYLLTYWHTQTYMHIHTRSRSQLHLDVNDI